MGGMGLASATDFSVRSKGFGLEVWTAGHGKRWWKSGRGIDMCILLRRICLLTYVPWIEGQWDLRINDVLTMYTCMRAVLLQFTLKASHASSLPPKPFSPPLLTRLTPIRPPRLPLLLAIAHARPQLQIHPRRHGKPEPLRHGPQIQCLHIEHAPQAVARIRLQVAAIAILGRLVEVVVLPDQLLELGLHVQDLFRGEVEFDERHARLFKVRQKTDLRGLEEEQRFPCSRGAPRGAAHAVDVVAWVVGGVVLDDPVDGGDVEAASGDVGAEEGALCGVAEFEEGVGAFLLLLLAVQVQHGEVDVVEEFAVVFDAGAGGEEDDVFLGGVAFEEGEEEEEAHLGGAEHVALLEPCDRAEFLLVVDVDVEGTRAEGDAGQVLDFGGLGGGEEHGLAVLVGEDLDDGFHFFFEADFEDAVGFVDDEGSKVLEDETLGVLEMVQQAARGGNDQVDALLYFLCFGAAVGAAHDDAVGLGMMCHELSCYTKDL